MDADLPQIVADLRKDTRFQIDDVALENLCLAAFDITWTRDPFDRLLVAHSRVRSLPLGTRDGNILKNYSSVL
ncbi:MAG TPA: hypothetical protein VLJ37_08615 [bacterium]|nr:hypothetical protein [bacterium]